MKNESPSFRAITYMLNRTRWPTWLLYYMHGGPGGRQDSLHTHRGDQIRALTSLEDPYNAMIASCSPVAGAGDSWAEKIGIPNHVP